MTVPVFARFVDLVSSKVATAVGRLPDVPAPCPLNEFALERAEYRRSKSGIVSMEKFASQTGEKALLECGTDMVRLSLKIAYEGPDASLLTKELEIKFFNRLARGGLACIRKKPIAPYDITFLFTCHDLGDEVEKLLQSVLPVCRKLSKQLRLSQVIENRRAGRNLFSKLINIVPKPRLPSPPTGAMEDLPTEGDDKIESDVTELGDLGNIEDLKNEDADKIDDIFLI